MLSDTFDRLVRVQIALWDGVDKRLAADHGLSAGRAQVLRAIARRNALPGAGCRVQDVAAELLVTVSGISKLVDKLEASGLCERGANPQDRRSSLLHLTDAGRSLLAEVEASIADELTQTLGALSPAELGALEATLNKLERA